MVVPGLVVQYAPFLDTLLRHLDCDMDLSVRTPVRRHDAQLYGVQGMPCITARQIRQKFQRHLVDLGVIAAHPFLRVIHGTL